MAVEGDRNGIPVRLNRIRTRPILPEDQSSSGGDDSPAPLVVGRVLPAVAVWKLDGVSQGSGDENRVVGGRKGLRKGRKIARWFSSYFATKSPYKAFRSEVQEPDVKMLNKKDILGAKGSINAGYHSQEQAILENSSPGKVSKSQKSFSHELGPRGGIRPALVRTYSYRDLKELLGSPHSKFDAAKELMNAQLAAFVVDVMDALEKDFYPREQQVAEDQQILAQKCIEMTSSQFREECERIVKNLAETRQQCQSDSMKQLITRMLLILTPCTRLLQFQKDSGPISEESLDRFKQCLDSLPAIDIKRVSKPAMQENSFTKYQLNKSEIAFCPPQSTIGTDPCNLSYPESQKVFPSNHEHAITACHKTDISFTNKMVHEDSLDSFHEHDEHHQGSDSVICRICEENIPASHWKFHFYICACADQCDIENLEIDGCLIRIAELLEQIVEFYNKSCLVSCNIPETSWMQSDNAEIGSECRSSIAQEFYNEGMEGMFEELHEMDTACLNDSHISTYKNLKSFLAKKFGTCLHTSLNETTMPASCTNTPRSSHSDSSWLEDNNPSEHEDVNQMNEMADIARKAANIDPGNKKVFELLNVCLLDLDDILQHSRLKALMIDTFGNRIKHILEEKYLLAKQLLDEGRDKTTIQREEIRGIMMVNESKFSASTALPPLHKDRTSIDDFDIMKPISRGAFGRVLLARKRTTGDLFAVKVLKKLHMIRKNDVDRMLAERDILVKVRNPFVVRFFYSFTSRDNLYLVMEYLNGGDLYSLLRKVGCLEEDVARTYIAELVLALEYLHSLGIIHRDLKPDNILIAQDGHIKLTDFGLSKIGLMNSAINLSGSGVTGSVPLDAQNHLVFPVHAQQRVKRSRSSAVGTPDYLAPEILLGAAHGYAADWWSVGIILFELITGIPPFTDRLPEMIFDNILNGNIPWPCVPEDMSYEAKDLIGRLLIQDQDQRLGANGASEVKAHPFFKEINWDNLSLQKAAFIPHPDSADDTSYFMPRYSEGSSQVAIANNSSDCTSDATKSSSDTGVETTVEKCSESKLSDSCTSLDFSSLRFSFKNRSELASMTYDVLLQSGKSSKCSSPSNGSYS